MSKNLWKTKALISVNLFSILLFLSWLFEPSKSFWQSIDASVFWACNDSLLWNSTWQTTWAIANNRAFDLVALIGIFSPFFYFGYKKKWKISKTFAILVFAALAVIVTTTIGKAIPIERESATNHFSDSVKLSKLVSFSTKDSSGDSFPGDHGVALIIYAGFAFFYLSSSFGFLTSILAVFFAFPRVMVGAHWFTDEIVGAVSLGLITLSFVFLTPLHNILFPKINSLVEVIFTKIREKLRVTDS